MKAPITLAIDGLVSDHLAPLLKQHRFRNKGQRFWRDGDGCMQLVELDRWKYNEGGQGRIGLAVGVFYAEVWAMVKLARPGWGDDFDDRYQPIQNCLVELSLDLPSDPSAGPQSQWSIDADADLDSQAQPLLRSLELFGLPWLEVNAVLRNTFSRLLELSGKKVWIASVYLLCAAVIEEDREIVDLALERVLAPKASRFFPESERNAFRALAMRLDVPGSKGPP